MTATQTISRPGKALNLPSNQASLIISGRDQPGIVAAITSALGRHGGNIVSLDQYSDDPEGGNFFQRTTVVFSDLRAVLPALQEELHNSLTLKLGLDFTLRDLSVPLRVAVFASKSDHCLLDILWRQRRGELPIVIPMVISNHLDLQADVESFGIPFHYVPSQGPDKSEAEATNLSLLEGQADLIVLARYMQIVSSDFINRVGVPIINIHHSFLPAFIGAGPYAKARERGVKLIGATAHYVTPELDEGPIIEQDVVRVTHSESTADLQRRGADVERSVLSRAVRWHSEDRVIRHGNHTIVFA
jgi:formyltetrahydrofolate deformylase